MALWLDSSGKLITDSGNHPMQCNDCPCSPTPPQTCADRVAARVAELLQETEEGGTPKWQVVANYGNQYTCATYQYNEVTGDWDRITPASGKLWIAFANSPTSSTSPYRFQEGTLLYRQLTGELKLVNCQCYYADHQCTPLLTTQDGYYVAGALDVDPANDCGVNTCDALKLYLNAGYARWGGTLTGEGYVEYDTTPENTPWQMGWVFFWDEGDGQGQRRFARLLNCECTEITTRDFNAMANNKYRYEYRSLTGICASPCLAALALAASAAANNQQLWHEGCFFPRDGRVIYMPNPEDPEGPPIPERYEWGSTYDFNHSSDFNYIDAMTDDYWGVHTFLMCKDNGDGTYSVVSCGCDETRVIDIDDFDTLWMADYPTDGKGIILPVEYSGACNCVDLREIVMAHAGDFGIIDASMGSNTVYRDANASNKRAEWNGTWYDLGIKPESVCFKRGDTHGAGTADYLDYRSLCVIKTYGWKQSVIMLTPELVTSRNIIAASLSQELIQNAILTCASSETADYTFTGRMEPFTYRASLDDYYYSNYFEPGDTGIDLGPGPIYGPGGEIVAVLKAWMSASAWWVCQGYICNCGGGMDAVYGCGATGGYTPSYGWGNPVGGVTSACGDYGNPYCVSGATTNRGFLEYSTGQLTNELTIQLCNGNSNTFCIMTPKGDPQCTGHKFIPPQDDSSSSD